MSEEVKYYRMQQKRDDTDNWNPSFIPKDGEIIVYKDEGKPSRIKIGNGSDSLA